MPRFGQPLFAPIPGALLPSSSGDQRTRTPVQFNLPEVQPPNQMYDESLGPPSFNVLYISPPRIPFLQDLGSAIAETVEFVKPITRLGLPKTSIYDKCPYRTTGSEPEPRQTLPLCSFKTRRLMEEIHTGRLYQEREVHIPRTRYFYGEVSPWFVAVLNTAVFVWVSMTGSA